jgi:hypothetical protein
MDAEEFLRIHALKAMTGALAATVIDLSPHALAQALTIGERGLARTDGVELRALPSRTAPVFDVTYRDRARSLTLRATLRQDGGGWLIDRLERVRGPTMVPRAPTAR